MLSSFCSPLNSIPDILGIISVVTAGIILVVWIISVVIGSHFGGGNHFNGGDHFGGGTSTSVFIIIRLSKVNFHKKPELTQLWV